MRELGIATVMHAAANGGMISLDPLPPRVGGCSLSGCWFDVNLLQLVCLWPSYLT